MSRIAGSRALVTGGARGIGRLLCRELVERGAEVVIWDLDADLLEQAVAELRRSAARPVRGDRCDVSDREAVYALARRVEAETGPVDILVNNAGVVSGRSFLELDDRQIERTFAVNSLALFWTTKAFLPGMMERNRGHVVTVASAAGWIGVAGLADYAASKFAAVGFDESLRAELRRRAPGVKTTVVCPYFVDTGMFDGVRSRVPALLPILREAEVARAILRAVDEDRPRVMMPPLVYTVPALRMLPLGVFDRIADVLGINASMEHFRGRPVRS